MSSSGSSSGRRSKRGPSDALLADGTKYSHGPMLMKTKRESKQHKRLRKTMKEMEEDIVEAATSAAAAEVLLPVSEGYIEVDEPEEKIYKLSQTAIKGAVDLNSAKQVMDLKLPTLGPYRVKYSRNGRSMVFGGRRGHVAVMNSQRVTVACELQLEEAVHDVQFLHNEDLFCVAQDKYTYMYDRAGTEIHCMRKHERPFRLDFLPYHFLLVTVGQSGWVKWHDVSTGDYVAGYATGHGPTRVLTHNPTNAVTHLGHSNGVVTLWSPAAGKPLVSMFTHKGPVTDMAVDRSGRFMATAGMDGFMKVWDMRKFGCIHAFKPDKNCTGLDISDKGLIGMSCGRHVTVLKDAFSKPTGVTYLKHEVRPCGGVRLSGGGNATASKGALASSVSVSNVCFRPFEDVLGIGHSHGVSTIVVPGAGEANFDSLEVNPFADRKQTREAEVHGLLYKLKPEMIALDANFVGGVDRDQRSRTQEHLDRVNAANMKKVADRNENRNRKKGRNKISAKLRRKQKNVVDAQTLKLQALKQKEKDDREIKREKRENPAAVEAREKKQKEFSALKRFQKKG